MEILGSRVCMESLQTDIQDVQWTINDVSSRVGPLDLSSWKFPDKLGWEVDVEQLLDMYSFADDEKEENQVAHIALYELLIDRLILLVQGTSTYVSQVQQIGKGGSVTTPSSSSVGPAVKHFWSQMTNLQSLMQQLQSQNKTNSRKVAELEKEMKKASSFTENRTSTTRTSPSSTPTTGTHSPAKEISCDESNKGCQTVETAFVPCEACDVVQRKMRDAGDMIIDVCHSQGLPSSLRKYKPQVSHVKWLTYNDVTRWMSEQNKDVQRLSKHIEQMSSTISPLKAEVAAFEKETKQAEGRAKQWEAELNREKETQTAVKRLYETKLQEKEKQHEVTLADLHRQREELLRQHTTLTSELSQRQAQTSQLETRLREWESKCSGLEKEVEERGAVVERLSGVERENSALKEQLETTRTQLETTTKTLAKEQGKNRSAAQHKQQVAMKQQSLNERVTELVQEGQELRDQVSSLEDSLQESRDAQEQLTKQKMEHEAMIKTLKEEKQGLEQTIAQTEAQISRLEQQLQESQERERLIVEYPDLNGPVNPDLQGTGDIAVDMENQVKANTVRIQLLEGQNQVLRRSISKVLSRANSAPNPAPNSLSSPQKSTAPVPLWQNYMLDNSTKHSPEQQRRHQQSPPTTTTPAPPPQGYRSSTQGYTPSPKPPPSSHSGQRTSSRATPSSDFFTVGKATGDHSKEHRKPSTGKGGRGGGSSGGGSGGGGGGGFMPVNSTSIGAYKQIRRAMGDNSTGQQGSGKRTPSTVCEPRRGSGEDMAMPTYVCQHCDKMYTKPRDLEIHKSYCTG